MGSRDPAGGPIRPFCGRAGHPGVLRGKGKMVLDTAGAHGILLVGVWVVRYSRDLARGSRRGVRKKVKTRGDLLLTAPRSEL